MFMYWPKKKQEINRWVELPTRERGFSTGWRSTMTKTYLHPRAMIEILHTDSGPVSEDSETASVERKERSWVVISTDVAKGDDAERVDAESWDDALCIAEKIMDQITEARW